MRTNMQKRARIARTLELLSPPPAQAQHGEKMVHVVGRFHAVSQDAKDENGEKLHLTYKESKEYALQKNKENYLGYSNWDVASTYDWQLLYNNRDHPDLKGSFNQNSKKPEDDYWTSTPEERDHCRDKFVHTCHFDHGDGWGQAYFMQGNDKRTVRLTRYDP